MNDEHFYTKVSEELLSSAPIPGLWAKAYAESNGNEQMAKALYLRLRVAQLRAEEEEDFKKKQDILRAVAEQERLDAQRKREEEGHLPNSFVIIFFILLAGFIWFVIANVLGNDNYFK